MAKVGDGKRFRNPVIMIPARLGSARLKAKILETIRGEAMILHVWRRACEAGMGKVVVACAEEKVADLIQKAGGEAVLTNPALPSGTDRIEEALRIWDSAGAHDAVINLQGDMPFFPPEMVKRTLHLLEEGWDMATLALPSREGGEDSGDVKAIPSLREGEKRGRALYFTRAAAPWGEGLYYVHVGIYAFRRAALARFCALPISPLEKREKLEQLRALEAGMTIGIEIVEDATEQDALAMRGIDTARDLENLRASAL